MDKPYLSSLIKYPRDSDRYTHLKVSKINWWANKSAIIGVLWQSRVASAVFNELSQLQVVFLL